MRTIDIDELRNSVINTWCVKDDSVRGYHVADSNEVEPGDMVVINNYFTLVTKNDKWNGKQL